VDLGIVGADGIYEGVMDVAFLRHGVHGAEKFQQIGQRVFDPRRILRRACGPLGQRFGDGFQRIGRSLRGRPDARSMNRSPQATPRRARPRFQPRLRCADGHRGSDWRQRPELRRPTGGPRRCVPCERSRGAGEFVEFRQSRRGCIFEVTAVTAQFDRNHRQGSGRIADLGAFDRRVERHVLDIVLERLHGRDALAELVRRRRGFLPRAQGRAVRPVRFR